MIQTSKTVINYKRLLKKAKEYNDQSIVIKVAKMKMLVQVNQCLIVKPYSSQKTSR